MNEIVKIPRAAISSGERGRTTRFVTVGIVLCVLLVLVIVIGMNTGYMKLSPGEVFRTLTGGGTEKQTTILYQFRLPRIVISVLAGAGLAVSGAIMQCIFRNPLADPGIIGIHSGAGVGVLMFVSFYPSAAAAPVLALPFVALTGAMLAAVLIQVLAGSSPSRLILTGIAVAAGIQALTIVLTLRLNPDKYQFAATWMAGSIWGSNWQYVLALLPWLVLLLPYVMSKGRTLDIMTLSEPTALSLGTSVIRERRLLLAVAVALAGSSVAVTGGIGFVGLIGPHVARKLVGPQHRLMLPIAALCGMLLLLIADTVGRWIMEPSEIPCGIMVALLGAPYFLYLLAKTKS